VTDLSDEGSGAPVPLIHASSIAVDARLTWLRFIPALAPRARVISYDQPGFGQSEVPGYLDRLQRAEHPAALMEALDLRDLTVIGHSEGGFIATRLALTCPDRIRKLVIVASGGTAPALGDGRDAAWIEASARTHDYIGRAVDEDTFVHSEGHLRYGDDPPFEAILRENFRRALTSGNVAAFVDRARRNPGYTALQERHVLPHLPTLRLPTLLVWGGRDETVLAEHAGSPFARSSPEAR
jgi:pimeloyl-ACP methyl ester carboxylesterase